MAESFTVFEKVGDVLEALSEQDARELSYALMMYGSCGVEVECGYVASALFKALKEDIDNSKQMRARGAKGGRPSAKPQDSEVIQDAKPQVSEDEKPQVSTDAKPQVSDEAKPQVSDKEPKNGNPIQSKPIQSKPKERKSVARFAPPAPHDVAAFAAEYAAQKGLDPGGFDAERFVGYYGSNGWKVGRNPMRDWRAAVRGWVSRDCKPAGGGLPDEYASL